MAKFINQKQQFVKSGTLIKLSYPRYMTMKVSLNFSTIWNKLRLNSFIAYLLLRYYCGYFKDNLICSFIEDTPAMSLVFWNG